MSALSLAAVMLACGSGAPEERTRYLEAMELVSREPEAAWTRCAAVAIPALADDCRLNAVEALAGQAGEPTAALLSRCATLGSTENRDECAFQVGERRDDPAACAQAGVFADDCRLHLLSRQMERWLPADADLADPAVVAALALHTRRVGLPEGDPRAASAVFRELLGRQALLDRGACRALASPWDAACWNTGRAVYEDRLNQARDRGELPCPGAALPVGLAHSPDPELDAARAQRPPSGPCAGEVAP